MKEKFVPQRKRLAMGDTLKGYAKGGTIAVDVAKPVVAKVSATSKGVPMSAITKARRNNGVKGM